jgi:hypothetical protein
MSWCKRPEPGKPPAPPRHVDVVDLHARVQDIKSVLPPGAPLPVEFQTLLDAAPPLRLDRWGMPLPFDAPAQYRIDRVAAILADPINRGRSLIRAGQLGPDETAAMLAGRQADYMVLKREVLRDVIVAGPPLPQWVEAQLAIFFQRPASQLLELPQQPEAPKASGGKGPREVPFGTPAERREQAVREER